MVFLLLLSLAGPLKLGKLSMLHSSRLRRLQVSLVERVIEVT